MEATGVAASPSKNAPFFVTQPAAGETQDSLYGGLHSSTEDMVSIEDG
jgi:hypothetical protein